VRVECSLFKFIYILNRIITYGGDGDPTTTAAAWQYPGGTVIDYGTLWNLVPVNFTGPRTNACKLQLSYTFLLLYSEFYAFVF